MSYQQGSLQATQIELTSPVASEQSRADCEAICKLGLKSKILTHIRCHMDVRAASSIIAIYQFVLKAYILIGLR